MKRFLSFILLLFVACYVQPPMESSVFTPPPQPVTQPPKTTTQSTAPQIQTGVCETGAELFVSSEAKELYPKVNPKNTNIITYIACGEGGLDNYDVWIKNLDEKSSIKVTASKASDLYASWTPDGKMLIFDSDRLPDARRLWAVQIPGGDIVLRLLLSDKFYAFHGDVSPQGNIAFVTSEGGKIPAVTCADGPEFFRESNYYIWSMDWDGKNLRRLNQGKDPAWSPVGKKLAFASNVSGNYDIWVMDWDGGNLIQITSSPSNELEPSWSPDGKWIAFTSDQSGNRDIWLIPSGGGQKIELTTSLSYEGGPCWSDDGYIYYHSNCRGGNWDIWRIKSTIEIGTRPTETKKDIYGCPPESYKANISVLNGTKVGGLAAGIAQYIGDKGFNITEIGNYKSKKIPTQTMIYYAPGFKDIALCLTNILPDKQYIKLYEGMGTSKADIRIVVGKNMAKYKVSTMK